MSLRSTLPRPRTSFKRFSLIALVGWILAMFSLVGLFPPSSVAAAPQLLLPTPPGEAWVILQGYACGTHNSWDRYSLDLAQVNGPTYNAPVRAALAGQVWHWESGSGTLILNHGGQFFTMYTHMSRAVSTQQGHYFALGETLGYAGDRGSPGVPHLHFTAYTANRDGWSGKQSVPLHFSEGYDLPEVGGCNQHGGKQMTAMPIQDPEIHFTSPAQATIWYGAEQRVDFTTSWAGGGISQAWDKETPADAPMFPEHVDGYALLSDAGEGMHTLNVRTWGPDGKQVVASYGPIGYDISPPQPITPIADVQIPNDTALKVVWNAAQDAHSGVAGYRVYIGPDPVGEADWFTAEAAIQTPVLQTGHYYVRVESIDKVGNASPWQLIGHIIVDAPPPVEE